MRIIILCLCLFCLTQETSAQSRAIKKFKFWEQELDYYAQVMEDFERAELYLNKMRALAEQKFKPTDSIYASAQLQTADLLIQQNYLLAADSFLNIQVQWLEKAVKAELKLDRRHYEYLLLSGNVKVFLGTAEKNDEYIIEQQVPAWVRKSNKRFASALNYFNTAIERYKQLKLLRPEHPDIIHNLAVVWREKGELQGRYMNDLSGCIESLNISLEYKKTVESYRLLGVALGMRGEHLAAVDAFQAALALNERNVAILFNLEVAYRLMAQQYPEKAEEYRQLADRYHIKWKAIDPEYAP